MLSNEELNKLFDNLQNNINTLYYEYGLTDEILDLQVVMNKLRNKYNIPDNSQLTKSNEGFVQ